MLIAGGAIGYHLIEGWPWFYALYVTVITLTSIGYGEARPLSTAGRLFTIVLALSGVSTIAVAGTELLGLVITGDFGESWRTWRMGKRIDALRQHVILCGYGEVGQRICADLRRAGVEVVVVDRKSDRLVAARDAGAHPLLGDASADGTLARAGIARARALVSVTDSDPENMLITVTARLLAPAVPIIARVDDESATPKLMRAGATVTVSPRALAAGRMAQAVLQPTAFRLTEGAAGVPRDLSLEEQVVRPGSALDGQTVRSSGLRAGRGLILIAIRRRDGVVAFNPDDEAPVAAGDTLILVRSARLPGYADGLALAR